MNPQVHFLFDASVILADLFRLLEDVHDYDSFSLAVKELLKMVSSTAEDEDDVLSYAFFIHCHENPKQFSSDCIQCDACA